MAANSSSRGIRLFGKRFTNQISNWNNNNNNSTSALASRRAAFSSLYDKNVDDQIHSGPVPDDVIQATQSSKYWGPHPQTGVFGPPGEQATSAAGDRGFYSASTVDASAASVLEEKAWFRPSSLEDLEKPHPHL